MAFRRIYAKMRLTNLTTGVPDNAKNTKTITPYFGTTISTYWLRKTTRHKTAGQRRPQHHFTDF
ncbi:hypothetical protein LSAJ160_230062 [Latilactobacillus sakei]|nr:hypothetical protein LSAJ160_230062 [Latilactobacillus sakei]